MASQHIPFNLLTRWLLEAESWMQYRVRIDLLEHDENDSQAKTARTAMINHHQIQELITELSDWPDTALKSHKDAKQPIHK